ncbi:MAG: YaaA family protein [Microbacteriaceae bacterium]
MENWCRDEPEAAAKALKLGPKSIDELSNNVFRDAPVLPAIERYTGVLYSATGVAGWTAEQRSWAGESVFIHSSLFGVISALDEIPAYRLSYDSKVRGVALKDFWGAQLSAALLEMAAEDWVLDCRSDGYRKLAPVPAGVESRYLDVVSANGGKALNHFNKIHKGELVRSLVAAAPNLSTPEALQDWAQSIGLNLAVSADRATLSI